MSWQHLVCAQCAGLVSEGRCPACRETRTQLQGQLRAVLMVLLAVAAALLALLVGNGDFAGATA